MAETLAVLIHLAERKVEGLQKALAQTRATIAAGRARMAQLEEEGRIAFAEALADDTVQGLQHALTFQERVRREIAVLMEAEAMLRTQETEQRNALQVAFGEQKRYEILLDEKHRKRRAALAKKQQDALDEVAGRI
jgi:flagellar export protein FliJ